jgi:hypothetical protein
MNRDRLTRESAWPARLGAFAMQALGAKQPFLLTALACGSVGAHKAQSSISFRNLRIALV